VWPDSGPPTRAPKGPGPPPDRGAVGLGAPERGGLVRPEPLGLGPGRGGDASEDEGDAGDGCGAWAGAGSAARATASGRSPAGLGAGGAAGALGGLDAGAIVPIVDASVDRERDGGPSATGGGPKTRCLIRSTITASRLAKVLGLTSSPSF
jgi:hypothetical protein